jgi:hypothetical protein
VTDPTKPNLESFTRTETGEGTELHSLRVPAAVWRDAKRRSKEDSIVMNKLITELLEGYGRGVYKLPATSVAVTRTYPEQPDQR